MFKCDQFCAFVIFCTVSSTLFILWTLYRRDSFVEIIKSDPATIDNKLFTLDFKYITKSVPCFNSTYLAVIIVTSYFGNVETRSAMRRSFSHDELEILGLKRFFLLGIASDDAYVTQGAIENEANRFGDIIQGNFKEAYRNLTYKHIMGLKWVAQYCPRAKYVIKMDDDIVFDVNGVVKLLRGIKLPSEMYIGGYVMRGMAPIRDPANKWYTTVQEYGSNKYPNFVSGWFYITTPKVCSAIVQMSHRLPYFWIDDVYVTGIVARNIKARHLNLNGHFAVHAELMQCCLRDLPEIRCDYLIGPNGGDNNMFYDFNKKASKCFSGACGHRKKPLNETCVAERKVILGHGNAVIAPYKLT